jgi:acetyl-CoA carboxylase biotin carboxyl carrier protein
MEIKDIKQLVRLMVESDLCELDIAEGETKIHLKRGAGGVPMAAAPMAPAAIAPAAQASSAAPVPAQAPASNLVEIKSPMVGTFYAAPSPDSEPFVGSGTVINDDSVVCIIEAMKVMNEIKAELSGTIVEICVKNAQPVEYGQVLFRVKPN